MARGMPSLLALLDQLAMAGYQIGAARDLKVRLRQNQAFALRQPASRRLESQYNMRPRPGGVDRA